MTINPDAWLHLKRTVRFGDTDAAGVIHFLNIYRWSHEAWEESLQNYGLKASNVFPTNNLKNQKNRLLIGLPIIHCQADFWRPIQTGDNLLIDLTPKKIDNGKFETKFKFKRDQEHIAQSLVRHQAIHTLSHQRCELPKEIELWLEASSLNNGISLCE